MAPLRPRRDRGDRAAVAVEFGLIMPILLLLVFGLIQYGLYFLAYQSGSDSIRSATRLSAVGQPLSCADLKATVVAEVGGFGSNIVVKRTFTDTDGSGALNIGDDVHLRVQFSSTDLHIPIVPFVADGRVDVEAVARMEYLNDGVPQACA